MSTRSGAAMLNQSADFGTVAKGKLVDLVALGEDLGGSVTAFHSITHVTRAGKIHAVAGLAGSPAK